MSVLLSTIASALAFAAPPPATATAAGRTVRLAYASYCWGTQCVDYIPPPQRTDLPRLALARGTRVRLRLAFVPSRWTASLYGSKTQIRLPAARTAVWVARRSGILVLEVKGPGGSAGYLLRLVVR